MGKLKDMAVERVDGVDKPAIHKRWVLVKSEDAATAIEKDYAGAAKAVVEAIAKEGVSFSDETVEVLRALVDLLELDVEFAAKSEDADETADEDEAETVDGDEDVDEATETADEDEADAETTDEVEKTSYSPDEVEDLLATFAAKHGIKIDGEAVAKSEDTDEVGRVRPLVKSRTPKGQDTDGGDRRKVSKGEGMFANIINGDAVEPYKR